MNISLKIYWLIMLQEFSDYQQAKRIAESIHYDDLLTYVYQSLSHFYMNADLLDSALFYQKIAEAVISYDGGKYGGLPGEGTGLGLSLAYDIIKAHDGEIKAETKVDEGNPDYFRKEEFTNFNILLPI